MRPTRPATRVRRDRPSTHVRVPGSRRARMPDCRRLHDAPGEDVVTVTLCLRGAAVGPVGVEPPLSYRALARRYGATPEDIRAVRRALRPLGLTVVRVVRATRSVEVRGTVAALESAFRPRLAIYERTDGARFRDREHGYQVPRALAGRVRAIVGFGTRPIARRRGAAARGGPRPFGPQALERHYAFPAGDGRGQRIAVAEFGGAFLAEDLAAYGRRCGRPMPVVQLHGTDRRAYTRADLERLPPAERRARLADSLEVMMDIEVIAGLCPRATIDVYFASFGQKGWIDLLDRVARAGPASLAISWGLAEDDPGWSAAARRAIDERLAALALRGVTVCVAAGDDGSGDEVGDRRAHVDFPASSPHVLAVGGTMLRRGQERAWYVAPGRRNGRGGGATGGGVSRVFRRPDWQSVAVRSVNRGAIDGRVVPDVAALAGAPFYDLVANGRPVVAGGTSAAAPLWAALIARLTAALPKGRRARFLTPLLYSGVDGGLPRGALGCRDIRHGQNTSRPRPGVGYRAGPGFDATTGWGTPDGRRLLALL